MSASRSARRQGHSLLEDRYQGFDVSVIEELIPWSEGARRSSDAPGFGERVAQLPPDRRARTSREP